ncbi:MAG: serine/threonine-protein kinase [Akkermansiaceae bacterium]
MDAEERYEIREKIGQGGVGAVYRAFDSHLNREIAIKRVLADGGYENQEEATKAMLKEASSLCSVQHPNIVTVFDAGVDNDGPFVVMELLSGRTVDEMVERGTLTFEDFRELALQSQEALIAAQDLDLVHRDIKPTNVMVTWLPSGRFQVKLVDFGLAKFSPKPSLQTIDHGDAVFGSIHFMAPEQFERSELDKRTDMYSIGCVYYFCLAGLYPFDGETAPQVMLAHLNHTVTHISEHRPDLPAWICDWVMWHLERKMDSRPADARESLSKFLMSENPNTPAPGTPEMPSRPKLIIPGAEPAPATPPAENPAPPAEPVTPTATPAVPTQTAPQPILPPEGARPSIHTQAQQIKAPAPVTPATPATPTLITPPAPEVAAPPVETPAAPAPNAEPTPAAAPVLITPAAPAQPAAPAPPTEATPAAAPVLITPAAPAQPAAPAPPTEATPAAAPILVTPAAQAQPAAPEPPVSPPVPVATTSAAGNEAQVTVHLQGATPPMTAPLAGAPPAPNPLGGPIQATAPGAPTTAAPGVALPQTKSAISTPVKAVIAATLAIGLIITSLIFISKSGEKARNEALNRLTNGVEEAEEVPMNKKDLNILLTELSTKGKKAEGERPAYQTALWKGVSTDNTDIDQTIAEFATGEATLGNDDARQKLFEVLKRRRGESAIPALIEFAGKTEKTGQGKIALETAGLMANSSNFSELLKVISIADSSAVKNQAAKVLSEVIKDSKDPSAFSGAIVSSYKSAVDTDTKMSLLRLMGASGGDTASEIVSAEIEKDDRNIKLAAIAALRQWPDGSMFETLHILADGQEDNLLRKESFDALVDFLTKTKGLEEEDLEMYWTDVATIAVSETEQRKVVQEMANQKSLWAEAILDYFIEDGDADASDRVIMQAEKAKRRLQERMRLLGEDE